jgi:hypothetical protein
MILGACLAHIRSIMVVIFVTKNEGKKWTKEKKEFLFQKNKKVITFSSVTL